MIHASLFQLNTDIQLIWKEFPKHKHILQKKELHNLHNKKKYWKLIQVILLLKNYKKESKIKIVNLLKNLKIMLKC